MAYTFKHGDRPIEGYTIQRAVGKGGFGEVYYAISDGGREVALKYLRDNPEIELRGVSNCINLKSPYLVAIFDVKQTPDGEYVIIMEYCSGPSLRDLLIAEPNGFEIQKVAFFMREIAKGLSYLHDRGIVHRDLKPGNLFYDDGYVKIGDYGLSKFISVSRHSGQTASVGTVHYMAPEIGSGNYSRGVDIYALGVMLYEMLLGKVPFEGSSMAEVLMKHLTTQPELDDLPHPFGRVIRKALEKDPKDRYQTVDEMVEELLEVETIRESLAGFSTKSLEGAARGVGPAAPDSPMPSPNPVPPYARNFPKHPGRGVENLPFAQPIRNDVQLSGRVHKRMDRISRKMEAKMAKLAGGKPAKRRREARGDHSPPHAGRKNVASIPLETRMRRRRLCAGAIVSIALTVGLGVVVANSIGNEDVGVSAGMLVVAVCGGILLSRRLTSWFADDDAPSWVLHLVSICCCTPLIALGAAPILDHHRFHDEGMAVWLGLSLVVVFGRWFYDEEDKPGHMSFGRAIWKAFVAAIATAFMGSVVADVDSEDFILLSAGVAGCASLILQASAWWLMGGVHPRTVTASGAGVASLPMAPPPPPQVSMADTVPTRPQEHAHLAPPGTSGETAPQEGNLRLRYGFTRGFWGLTAFILMGGAIVTFLVPLVSEQLHPHDVTAAIIACTGLFSFTIFALCKTTPIKRDGFWRESLRPFLIALMMFGIGGTITGISREWGHRSYCNWAEGVVRCVPDEGRVALIAGLVMCSILFLGLLLFTGRKRRLPPQPFVLAGSGHGGESYENSPTASPDDQRMDGSTDSSPE